MSRDWRLYWEDLVIGCEKILRYTEGMDSEGFRQDQKTYDAVLRNLEIIGEAAKNLPGAVKSQLPEVEWRKIAALRDVIAHGYFGNDGEIIWDIVGVPGALAALDSSRLDERL